MEREQDALRRKIGPKQSQVPRPELIGGRNRHLKGRANYFQLGHPRKAFGPLNRFVRDRLGRQLRRRSQRGWRAREGVSLYAHLAHLGLVLLSMLVGTEDLGESRMGNLAVRNGKRGVGETWAGPDGHLPRCSKGQKHRKPLV